MALTPEDVVNQKFTITKFRDGYDLDQVDDFLDSIVEELRQHEAEKDELRAQITELTSKLEACEAQQSASAGAEARAQQQASDEEELAASEQTIVVDAPKFSEPQPQAPANVADAGSNDALKSSAMLQLALELHDKHVQEGEAKREQLIRDAQATATQMVQEAQRQRVDELKVLADESAVLRTEIQELREFEGEYRTTLRSYIQSQLRNLEGSPEPDGAPNGLH